MGFSTNFHGLDKEARKEVICQKLKKLRQRQTEECTFVCRCWGRCGAQGMTGQIPDLDPYDSLHAVNSVTELEKYYANFCCRGRAFYMMVYTWGPKEAPLLRSLILSKLRFRKPYNPDQAVSILNTVLWNRLEKETYLDWTVNDVTAEVTAKKVSVPTIGGTHYDEKLSQRWPVTEKLKLSFRERFNNLNIDRKKDLIESIVSSDQ